MQFIGIIPARYASTRFPGKPLVEIQGMSMIERVYRQTMQASSLDKVLVATDDTRIFEHVKSFGNVVYTSPDHPSGTDRCFEAALHMQNQWGIAEDDVIVNIQGDEPFIHPAQIDMICKLFDNAATRIATLIKPITNPQDLWNENVVKVVRAANGNALYFSRSPIPFCRGTQKDNWLVNNTYFKHIGMYAYRMGVLKQITTLTPSQLEKTESLEQLRWLENGFAISTHVTELESLSVDTPEDLKKIL